MKPHEILDYWRLIAGTAHRRGGPAPTVLELGAADGADGVRMARRSGTPIHWVGLEPDPRNFPRMQALIAEHRHLFASTASFELAASDTTGEATMFLSSGEGPGTPGLQHTVSSSLNAPTRHLQAHPWCTFDQTATVRTVRVDDLVTWARHAADFLRARRRPTDAVPGDGLGEPLAGAIDLVWADVQGAQRKVLAGAARTLARTRFLYIECHADPLYEDEPTLAEMLALLPDWTLVAQWYDEVLLQNMAF